MFEYLFEAVEAGHRDRHELLTLPSLDTFRDDPRFKELIQAIEKD